ncbi:MAG: ABC transporter permease [Lachnospiraceae bacterium]|nr:ABC transporter permease [Lachnospiraceae bacterium]
MKISDLLSMSLGSLFKRKVRTILTVLGVVIGTTSIVVMLSLGIGMKESMLEEMQSSGGLTSIEVNTSGGWGNEDSSKEELRLDDELVQALSAMEHVSRVDPILEATVIIKKGVFICFSNVRGVTQSYFETQGVPLGEGHFPRAEGELEFLYGNTVIQSFRNEKTNKGYWETGELPDIDLMNDPLYVIFDTDRYWSAGSTDAAGQIIPAPKKYIVPTAGLVAGGVDDWNIFSYYTYCDIDMLKQQLARVYKGRVIPGQPTQKNGKAYKQIFYSQLIVTVDDMENVSAVQENINAMGYQTWSSMEWIESDMQIMNIVQAVLGGIGAVSLLVAAIGITNTMMMSIYERTKEIGIMKVIGCRIRDIQALFLIEAGYIGLIGGTLGVGLSYVISMVVNKVVSGSELGAQFQNISRIPLWLGGISVVFAILIAMLAGFFPSVRAMKLSPLAAIRAE